MDTEPMPAMRLLLAIAIAATATSASAGITTGPDPQAKPPLSCCSGAGGSSGGPQGGGQWGTNGLNASGPAGGSSDGMPTFAVNPNLVGLVLTDTPLRYESPKGPAVDVTLTYNQKDSDQPATFTYANLGTGWTLNWIEYVSDNPNAPGSGVSLYLPDGQARSYSGYNASTGAFAPEPQDGAHLVRVSASPIRYERRFADGSIEVFAQSDTSTAAPRRIFLTERVDPAGNRVTVLYDATGRIKSLLDALGRSTTFAYNNSASPLLITSVSDPFGRTASIGYDATGRVNSITDSIGLNSTVGYAPNGKVGSLTTPYGTSTFAYTESGYNYDLVTTDALGRQSRYQFVQGAPGIPFSENATPSGVSAFNSYINARNTFYWDAQAMSDAPNDYTKARIFHWEHKNLGGFSNTTSDALESTKYPLENRIWNNYPGAQGGLSGYLNKPAATARLRADGSTQLSTNTYNEFAKPIQVVQPDGLVTTYTYAPNGQDALTIRRQGPGYDATETFTWNAQHEPLTFTDELGHTTTYTYNPAGQKLSERDALGNTTYWTYDSSGFLTSQKDRNGKVTTFTHDGVGRMSSQTDAAGFTTSFTYDNLDRLVRTTFWDNTFEEETYDKLDKVAHRDRTGAVTGYAFNAGRKLISATDPNGGVTRFTYYANDKLKAETTPTGEVTRWVRDIEGRETQRIAPNGGVTTTTYDATNRVASVTNAMGFVTTNVAYDSMDRLIRRRDPNGVITDFTYNARGWPTGSTVRANADGSASAADAVTTLSYDFAGNVISSTDPDGVRTDLSYDSADRLVRLVEPSGGSLNYVLDGEGNRLHETNVRADGATVARKVDRTFDALNQLLTVVNAQGKVTRFEHDADRNESKVTDPLNRVVTSTFDPMRRPITRTRTDGGSTKFVWDAASRLASIVDPGQLVTQFAYDASGRPVSESSPDAGSLAGVYDATGHLQTSTDARGIVKLYAFDALGRPRTIKSGTAAMDESYFYDEPASVTGCPASFPIGRRTRMMDGQSTTTYCYDRRGNVTRKTQVLSGGTSDTVEYTYTLADRVSSTSLPSGTLLVSSYDANGRIASIRMEAAGAPAQVLVSGVTYLPFGPVENYSLGGTQVVSRVYDANYWLTAINSPAIQLGISRDASGLPLGYAQVMGGGAVSGEKIVHDKAERLSAVAIGTQGQSFTWNASGDRLTKTGIGNGAGAYTYQPGTHRLASIGGGTARTYDSIGNLTSMVSSGESYSFSYDLRNRLSLVNRGGADVATYTYNPLGQRVSKLVTVPTMLDKRFVYDENAHLLAEKGSSERDYVWMDGVLVGILDGSGSAIQVSYVHADGFGAPRAVTNAGGTLLWSWSYVANPFGEKEPDSTGFTLDLRFPGQYHDAESTLYHNGEREYEPATGRYTQSDPFGLNGGINSYGYAYGSPLKFIDPTGLNPDCQRLVEWRGKETEQDLQSRLVDTHWNLYPNDRDLPYVPDPENLNPKGIRKELKNMAKTPEFYVECLAYKVETFEDTYNVYQDVKFVDLCVEDMGCGIKVPHRLDAGTVREPLGSRTRERKEVSHPYRIAIRTFLPAVIECPAWLNSIR
jgi:RHS repeat-associated protein